jgi:hypothetical protein
MSRALCAIYIVFLLPVCDFQMWVGGYDINLIWLILLCFVLFMVVFNGLIDLCEETLPVVLVEAFRHGGEDQSINQSQFILGVQYMYTRENFLFCYAAVLENILVP